MMVPYLSKECIRQRMDRVRDLYWRERGKKDIYPLDSVDLLERLYDFATIYDERGVINEAYGNNVIGCLFPPSEQSPWGCDRVVAVNWTPTECFDPSVRSDTFTVAHEVAHWVLHYSNPNGEQPVSSRMICRAATGDPGRKPRIEWQADFAAGELLMPVDEIARVLDGKRPGDTVDLSNYETRLIEHFGGNRKSVETRLYNLGFEMLKARYSWIDPADVKAGWRLILG